MWIKIKILKIGEIIFCAGLVRRGRSLVFNTEERFRFVGPAQNITVVFCAGPGVIYYDFLYSTFGLSKLVIDFSVIDPGICMIQFPGWTYIIHSTINSK